MKAIDWATKKEIVVFNSQTGRTATLKNSIPKFEDYLACLDDHDSFYLEEGGGDSIKLLLRKHGHRVFAVPGKRVEEIREERGQEKSDKGDAKIIAWLGEHKPDLFREFQELDELSSRVVLLFKIRMRTEENKVREDNRMFALKNQLELLELKGKEEELGRQQALIDSLKKQLNARTRLLRREIKKHPLFKNYLQDVKGVEVAGAGGIIAALAGRTFTRDGLRHFVGMIPKKGNPDFTHWAKRALYFVAKGIIMAKNKKWYPLYLNMKEYYRKKHPGWPKCKIDNYAKKFIETKFIEECWKKMKELKC